MGYDCMIYLRAGSSFMLEVKVSDILVDSYIPIAPDSITITLFNSHGTLVINNATMQASPVIGYYSYLFQSTLFMLNGAYRVIYRAQYGSESVITKACIAFVLVDGIEDSSGTIVVLPDHFDYIIIKDSANTLWYWSIVSSSIDASDADFTLINAIPTDVYLAANDITPSTIPYGLQVLDELSGTVYIYPDTLGQVNVDTSPPTGSIYDIGSGLDMIGRDRITYRYSGLSYLSALLVPISYPPI